jgi:hypothetical protein
MRPHSTGLRLLVHAIVKKDSVQLLLAVKSLQAPIVIIPSPLFANYPLPYIDEVAL